MSCTLALAVMTSNKVKLICQQTDRFAPILSRPPQQMIYCRLSADKGYVRKRIRGQSVRLGFSGFFHPFLFLPEPVSGSIFIFDQRLSHLRSKEFFLLCASGHAPIWSCFVFFSKLVLVFQNGEQIPYKYWSDLNFHCVSSFFQ